MVQDMNSVAARSLASALLPASYRPAAGELESMMQEGIY